MKHLALIGMSGTGKSTIGEQIANELGWGFVDSDALVVERVGKPITELFAEDGEAKFRDTEAEVLRECFQAQNQSVISIAGGGILRTDTRALAREHCFVVWLRATIDTLVQRLGEAEGRPLLAGDPRANLEKLLAEREEIYLGAANAEIAVDDRAPEEIAHGIVVLVKDLGL